MTPDPVQERITAYWDVRAPAYHAAQQREGHAERAVPLWQEALARVLPPAPAQVLDLGTGSGYLARVLADLGHDVTGLDLSEGMLGLAREHAGPGLRFVHGDVVDPPFDEDAFDVLAGRYVMWTTRDPLEAMAAWRRVLRPGGRLVLADSTWFPEGLGGDEALEAAYDGDALAHLPVAEARSIAATADLLRRGGFRDVEVVPLEALHALDLELGAAPGHAPRLQHLVTARP